MKHPKFELTGNIAQQASQALIFVQIILGRPKRGKPERKQR